MQDEPIAMSLEDLKLVSGGDDDLAACHRAIAFQEGVLESEKAVSGQAGRLVPQLERLKTEARERVKDVCVIVEKPARTRTWRTNCEPWC